jgi:hypothetical protein
MDDASAGSTPQQPSSRMILKKKSSVMDDVDAALTEFKASTPDLASSAQFSKQLTLLTEMGFTDTDFNLKTLQAANGNIQDALEIIVAANQRLRKKKSISSSSAAANDEFDSSDLFASAATKRTSQPIVDLMDALELGVESRRKSSVTNGGVAAASTNTASSFIDDSNPWSQLDSNNNVASPMSSESVPVVVEQITEPISEFDKFQSSSSSPSSASLPIDEDPLAFNPFKSTTSNQFSDDLFANPW